MGDALRWQFEMTRDAVGPLQQDYEWALQRQNQRFVAALPMEKRWPGGDGLVVAVIAILGLSLLGLVYLLDPTVVRRHPGWFLAGVLVFGVGLVAARYVRAIRGWSRRKAGAMLGRHAARTFGAVDRRAPYTIEYELAGDELAVRAPKLRVDRALPLRRARLVLHGRNVLFAYRRRHSVRPFRFLYVPSDAEHAALRAAFERCGATLEPVTGPVDGYTAPIPEARVR